MRTFYTVLARRLLSSDKWTTVIHLSSRSLWPPLGVFRSFKQFQYGVQDQMSQRSFFLYCTLFFKSCPDVQPFLRQLSRPPSTPGRCARKVRSSSGSSRWSTRAPSGSPRPRATLSRRASRAPWRRSPRSASYPTCAGYRLSDLRGPPFEESVKRI